MIIILNHKRFGFSEVMGKFYKILPKEAMEVTASIVLILFVNLSFLYSLNFQHNIRNINFNSNSIFRALPIVSKVVTAISGLEANFPSLIELDLIL